MEMKNVVFGNKLKKVLISLVLVLVNCNNPDDRLFFINFVTNTNFHIIKYFSA